jgi:tRNA pseudouridine38-40 synthase
MLYRFCISYTGTAYHGWQIQEKVPTVMGTLSDTFEKVFKQPIALAGASRTDTGVHAYGQVVRGKTIVELDPVYLSEMWNRVLPLDIVVRTAQHASDNFHPRMDVLNKTYWYHVFTERPLPWLAPYGFYCPHSIDQNKLEEMLQLCVGTHDFRSFCTGEYSDTIRTITAINLIPLPRYGGFRIVVQGPRFLYLMIRRIVGSALYIAARRNCSATLFYDTFTARNATHHLPTAPAQGLLLRKIQYNTP